MSYSRSMEEAKAAINSIQVNKTDGDAGGSSSPILNGSSTPGTSMSAPVSEMVPRRTKVKVRTGSLTRNWASN